MSDTYTQLYIQLIFAVKGRNNFIQCTWEEELFKYLTAVVQNDRHKMIAINGMPDHIHIFLGLHPAIAISDLMKDVKRASHNWINERGFIKGKFEWQVAMAHFPTEDHRLTMCINIFLTKRSTIQNNHLKQNT